MTPTSPTPAAIAAAQEIYESHEWHSPTGELLPEYEARLLPAIAAIIDRHIPATDRAGWQEPLKVLEENCWDLRQHEIKYDDDSDVVWHVVEFHMAEPRERIRGYGNSPLAAITDALKEPTDPTKWDYVPEDDEPPSAPSPTKVWSNPS